MPNLARAKSQPNSWSEIVRILSKLCWQVLEVVADACINRETRGEHPVVLDESRIRWRGKIRAGISERLSVLIRLPIHKRIEGREDVDCTEAIVS